MPESNRDEIAKLEALYATNPAGRVFTHLAEAYRKAGEYDRARAILEQGLEKHPTYASAHVVLGRVLMDLNKSDEAVESFRKVLQLDPHNLVALRSLGDLARAAGRNAEAMGYFEELRHQDSSNEEISGIIAELLAAPDFHAAEPPEPLPELLEPGSVQPPSPEPVFEAATPEAQLEEIMAEAVEPDWAPAESEGETLPGDLADFARQTAPTEDYGTVNLEEETPIEPAVSEAPAIEPEVFEPPVYEPPEVMTPEPEPEQPPFAEAEEFAPAFADFEPPLPQAPMEEPAAEEPAEVEMLGEAMAADEPLADLPPADIPLDLGPSDLDVEVAPEETLQSIDFSEFSAAAEEPAFEEKATPETTLEPAEPEPEEPEPQPAVAPVAEFEPAPELAEETPIVFEPAAEIFEPAPESFEPAPIETFEEPPALEPAPELSQPAQSSAEVVTETMAELYRSQGLNDRAAEVYRALLQDHPGATHLHSKLREVEAEMMQPTRERESDEAVPLEIKSPWTSFNQAAATSPSPYAWKEDTETDDEPGRPVSEYFQTLLSWRPTQQVQSGFTEVTGGATEEHEFFDLGEPIETAEQPLFEEPLSEKESGPSPMTAREQMPWDEPGMPGSPAEPAAADDFDDWFSEEPPPEQSEPAQPAAPSTPPSMAAETGDSDEEDDDLEMFRSWLQSLKK
jgi:tetratricopeptide (TPR) repeat protein